MRFIQGEITQLRSRHTKQAWNRATSAHTPPSKQPAFLTGGFSLSTSLSWGLSIMRRHKGHFYKLQRGPIYNKQALPEIFMVRLYLFIYLLSRRKCCGFCFAINIPKTNKVPKISLFLQIIWFLLYRWIHSVNLCWQQCSATFMNKTVNINKHFPLESMIFRVIIFALFSS